MLTDGQQTRQQVLPSFERSVFPEQRSQLLTHEFFHYLFEKQVFPSKLLQQNQNCYFSVFQSRSFFVKNAKNIVHQVHTFFRAKQFLFAHFQHALYPLKLNRVVTYHQ